MRLTIFLLFLVLLSPPAPAQTSKPVDKRPQPCICPLLFLPVCGKDGKTYSNRCLAACSNIAVMCQGACPCKGDAPSSACSCPRVFKPVCGKDGKNYLNGCLAACADTDIACRGLCPCKAASSPASKPATP